MKTTILIILAALLLVTAANVAGQETGTMFCERGIISIGDTIGEVLSKCGPPTYAAQRDQKRVEGRLFRSRERIITTVTVDDWIYNFGPHQFQYQVIFENGRVARIVSLEYGY